MDRVLLVAPTAKPGGSERWLVSMASGLPAVGFEPVTVLLEHGPLQDWLRQAGCEARVLPAGRFRYARQTARTIARLRGLVRETEAAVVLSSSSKGHIYGGAAVLRLPVPEVWMQHVVPDRSSAQERLAALVPTAAVVCATDAVAAAQLRMRRGAPVVKIPAGVPVEKVAAWAGSGGEIRRRLGWDGHPVVGIVARLQPWKGQEVFLRAAALLHARRPDVRYAVVGGAILGREGTYAEDIERLATELGLARVVHFAGHRDDVYAWYDALDVVVHASFGEPFGLTLVEALALGKPLVASADGGPLEIVEDGRSGLLFPPGDASALAAAVERVLDEPPLAQSLALGARARAAAFDESLMVGRIAELLRRVVAGGAPA